MRDLAFAVLFVLTAATAALAPASDVPIQAGPSVALGNCGSANDSDEHGFAEGPRLDRSRCRSSGSDELQHDLGTMTSARSPHTIDDAAS